jgi:DNA-directed RNA polymerase subunit RPC12/RpoP
MKKQKGLESCPFCGHKIVLKGDSRLMYSKYYIGCNNCPAIMYGDRMADLEKAWKRRAEKEAEPNG